MEISIENLYVDMGLKGLIQPLTKMLSARDGDTCNETKLNWSVSCFFSVLYL